MSPDSSPCSAPNPRGAPLRTVALLKPRGFLVDSGRSVEHAVASCHPTVFLAPPRILAEPPLRTVASLNRGVSSWIRAGAWSTRLLHFTRQFSLLRPESSRSPPFEQ